MSTKLPDVRGIALCVVLLLGVLLVILGFSILFFGTTSACRVLSTVGFQTGDQLETQSRPDSEDSSSQHEDLISSSSDDIRSHSTEAPSGNHAQHSPPTSQYGSSSTSTTVPNTFNNEQQLLGGNIPDSSITNQTFEQQNETIIGPDIELAELSPKVPEITLTSEIRNVVQTTEITETTVQSTTTTAATVKQLATVSSKSSPSKQIPPKIKIPQISRITNLLSTRLQSTSETPSTQNSTTETPLSSQTPSQTDQKLETTEELVGKMTVNASSGNEYDGQMETITQSEEQQSQTKSTTMEQSPSQPLLTTKPYPTPMVTAHPTTSKFDESTTISQSTTPTPDTAGETALVSSTQTNVYSESSTNLRNEHSRTQESSDRFAPSTIPHHQFTHNRQSSPRPIHIWWPHLITTTQPQRTTRLPTITARISVTNVPHIIHGHPPPYDAERSGVDTVSRMHVASGKNIPSERLNWASWGNAGLIGSHSFEPNGRIFQPSQPHFIPQRHSIRLNHMKPNEEHTFMQKQSRHHFQRPVGSTERRTGGQAQQQPPNMGIGGHQLSAGSVNEFQQFPNHREVPNQADHFRIPQSHLVASQQHQPLLPHSHGSVLRPEFRNIASDQMQPAGKSFSRPLENHGGRVPLTNPMGVPLMRNERLEANILGVQRSKMTNDERHGSNDNAHQFGSSSPNSNAISVDRHPFPEPSKHSLVQHAHRHNHHHHEHYDLHSPVLVTALLDIGRGKWPKYTRTYEQYMSYLANLLTLKNRMVIFTDRRGAEFVRQKRHHSNTQIFEITMQDLPFYRYRDEMVQLIAFEQQNWRYDEKMRDKPEAMSADYDLLVNSKAYFLYNATQSSRFRGNAIHFVWIDAGYGHGDKTVIPFHCHWKPKLLDGLITVIKLTPSHDKIKRYSINDLYRVDWSVVSGGFLAGDITTINRFYRFYHKTFIDLLDERKVDDDQTVLTLTIKNYASIFNVLHSNGDWFALFRLFPCS